ncbi:MAG TPA: hypothetical protein VJ743_18090 [Albitalea sp.]|nr:hypothetical protein [Albitalea sp.]
MTLNSLQALAWSTVTGAVVSALLIASGTSESPRWMHADRADATAERTAPATDIGVLQSRLAVEQNTTIARTERTSSVR